MSNMTWKEAWDKGPGPRTPIEYLVHFLKGFCMGVADLIPGVSGGTIAFITGIYAGLLEAVASLNKNVFKSLFTFKFKEVASQVHLRFIIPLGMGMVLAILSLARLMHYLIKEQPVPTWALFFGLIAASIIVIWKQLEDHFHSSNILMIIFGAVFAYLVVGLIPVETPDSWWFIYLCGIIGITAMILPGISGSFLLLILGKYEYITGAIKNPLLPENMVIIGIFLCGTATGLLGFSKILNWLMKHYHSLTMAWLTGILIGSMRKVWPWKEVLETKVVRGKVKILREANVMPPEFNSEVWLAVALIIIGFVAVLLMDYQQGKRKSVQVA
jgi:putative membrane protein